MTTHQTGLELLERLEAFSIDDREPCALDFTSRLARENGWSQPYTARVVDEYKRFLFLAMTAGHMVTPSEQVDQAWHLHLAYTKSYWERLCGEVLGRPLHHNPTEGGPEESARFRALYEDTKTSYRLAFGEDPPDDIWPASDVRFGDDLRAARVNIARNVVVRRGAWHALLAAIAAASLLAVVLAAAG